MNDIADLPLAKRDIWLSVKRGLTLRCPNCGKGKVLAGYLKPAQACDRCGESFSEIRADDGPAWATILLVGHLTSPFFFLFATPDAAASFTPFLLVASGMVAMTLALLPRMKGLFIGLIWANRAGEPAPTERAASEQLY